MSTDFFTLLIAELGKILAPLRDAAEDPRVLESLLAEIGANSENAGGDSLATALGAVIALVEQIDQLGTESSPSITSIAALLEASRTAFTAVRSLSNAGGPAAMFETLGIDLANLLVIHYLWNWHRLAHEVAILATLIEPADQSLPSQPVVQGGIVTRMPFQMEQFRFDRLSPLVKDPAAALRAAYGNPLATVADANAMADKLFPRVLKVLRALGMTCRYGFDPADAALLSNSAPFVDHALIIYTADMLNDAEAEAGIIVTISSADRGDLGFVFSPFGGLTETWQVGNWSIELDLTADVQGFAVGRHGFTFLAGPGVVEVGGKLTATFPPPDNGPAYILGTPTGSRIEIGGVAIGFQTTLSEAQQSLAVSMDVSKSAIVVASGDGDSFLRSVLPSDGLRTDFDLGFTWSSKTGLSFRGAAGLDATLPIGVSVGGILTIPSVHLGLYANDTGVQAETSASVGLTIGPVQALVDRVGLTGEITFPTGGGNLGPADFAFTFKPPSGVGLAIDAAGVSGGGFLSFTPAQHEYSGVLQLQFEDLALQAFGLITTHVAGDGYSVLALVDADFPPVQLGWGFTLDGVGGLLAIHRTASADALRAAVRAGKLSFLFPKNAITSAAAILPQLDALFPTAPGRFLFGLMAKIGWGTPTILTASLAVILELPEPVRIILLGTLEAKLPTASSPLVQLNMDALGILDLSQGELSLDASLFDSKLITYVISGDMALRANWLNQREFVLAIGGLHPRYMPPAGFPALSRITIDMPSGLVAKLRLAAYLALTSNSVQFGATLDVFIGVSGYGLSGHLAFDALLQLDPFHFDADISGSVALTAGGDDLMSVSLDATLTGPAPWNIAGKFNIHVIFFDVGVSFSHSWGLQAPAPQSSAVDVGALLAATLADPRNWASQLPPGLPALVPTRQVDDASAVFAHPMARLEVRERIVPLGLAITRFGRAAPSGASQFAITDFRVGSAVVGYDAVQDDFAPAQFFDLSDAEKLARPSFERHDAGAVMRGGMIANGALLQKTTNYETFFIDTPGAIHVDSGVPQPFPWGAIQAVLLSGAAAQKEISRAGKRRYAAPGNPIHVAEPAFALVNSTTLALQGATSPAKTTYSDVQAVLAAMLAAAPGKRSGLQIVATHELGAS